MTDTVDEAVDRALVALDALGLLGEDVEDEWTYVTDLVAAQRSRLEAVAGRRSGEPLPDERSTGIELAIAEIAAIHDPNRAIDWLSTFPDLIALALDEPIDTAGGLPARG